MSEASRARLRALDAESERRKLAHVLGVSTDRLGMLDTVPPDQLMQLRGQVVEALFQADKHYFTKVATLSKTVPVAVSAKVTELALPPLVAARTAELLEPAKAMELIARLSDRYVADVSAVLDPARSPELIAAIPAERIAVISVELARRGEWVVIGGFATVISDGALRATVATLNGEQLLRIGFVLDDVDKIDTINAMLSDQQVDEMLAAAADLGLWTELADQLEHMSDDRLDRLARRFQASPESVRAGLRDAADSGEFDAAALALLTR